MSTLAETVASYLPPLILRRLAAHPAPLAEAVLERFPAAVLFADISGFTGLTERLAQHGLSGAETLAGLLNDYFEQLIALIGAHGGEVEKLAGDAIVALWSVAEAASDSEALATATLRAAQCGLALQQTLNDYPVAEDTRLSVRVAINAGEVMAMHVGGLGQRWELLLAGAPLDQIGAAAHQARPGDVVLAPDAWTRLRTTCLGTPLHDGAVRLEAVQHTVPQCAAARPVPPPAAEAALLCYVPIPIQSRLAVGQTGWLAELRQITSLFVNLPDLGQVPLRTAQDVLERSQTVVQTLQAVFARYEGSITRLGVDDKGITLMAAFGLPPLAHENDAVRGVQAALEIQARLRELGVRCAIGITTGRAFCGSVGSDLRREYTMHGDVVNMAARLMQAAPGDILCDTATYQAAHTRLQFESLPPLTVKGKTAPMAVYRPYCVSHTTSGLRPIFGRAAERATLTRSLNALPAGEGTVILIEGEAGIGKSRLLAELQSQAQGVTCWVGAGDAIEKSTPYHAWRPVFSQLFGVEGLTDSQARRRRILERLEAEPEWLRLAPLLNSVLPLDLPENELTVQMSGQVRADNTHDLLLRILQDAANRAPTVLLLEDAHWLDSASWAMALLVSRHVQPLLLVVATRPLGEPLPADYRHLLQTPNLQRLRLDALPAENVLELVCQRLGVSALPPAVAALIQEKAQGNPFFSEELAYALRDAGLLVITGGVCYVASNIDLATVALPDSVQGVITSRLDRLTPAQQLTLKVASVIGRVFAFRVLHDIFPVEPDKGHLSEYLGILERLDLTSPEPSESDLAYIFKHIITQEVAYNLMLFAQRRQLHRAVANWYERTQAQDLAPFYPLLAHHWQRAEDKRKTIDYLEKAGEQALCDGAYQEAVEFFCETLALDNLSNVPSSRLRRARWERQLGDAYLGLGQLNESRQSSQQALSLLGHPAPITSAQLIVSLVRQVWRQVWHRCIPQRSEQCSSEMRDICRQAAGAYERIGHICYYTSEAAVGINASLCSLNLAEVAGPSSELARSFAAMCLAVSIMGLHTLARIYARRAFAITETLNDISTQVWVLECTGIYSSGVGQWEQGRERLRQAVELSHRLGDWRRWEESLIQLAILNFHQGEFACSAQQSEEVSLLAEQRGDNQVLAWALVQQALTRHLVGHDAQALALLEAADTLRISQSGFREKIWNHGIMAVVRCHRGEHQLAHQTALEVLNQIKATRPVSNSDFDAYAGMTETYLTLWESGGRQLSTKPEQLALEACQACAALHRFARVFPIGQPRAWIYQGWADWLAGKHTKAHKAWRKSLAASERLGMPYEEGLAHYEIGRHLKTGDPGRQEHLTRACDIFTRLGATCDLARARAAARE